MKLFWPQELATHLQYQRIIVLYGNIHDVFPDSDGRMKTLEDTLLGVTQPKSYDNHIVDGAFGDDGQSRGHPAQLPPPERVIDNLVSDSNAPVCWIVRNTQSLFAEVRDDWNRPFWQCHERLLRAIKNRPDRDRFILLFPDETRIHHNFLNGVPGTRRMSVPLPYQNEREVWLAAHPDVYSLLVDSKDPQKHARFIAETDGLRWRDLDCIRALCIGPADPLKLVREFKFGKGMDHWANLKSKTDLHKRAFEEIVDPAGVDPLLGQDDAVKRALAVVAKACLNLSEVVSPAYNRPRGILFLVGPTGVGKTMLAKKLANFIFGSEEACLIFDMTEYTQEHVEARLVGAPPGYVGHEAGGQLTNAIRDKPFSVLLFDEIDKADPSILTKFMQVLDEGRLTDGKGQTCYFSECLILFTSNAGADELTRGEQPLKDEPDIVVDRESPYEHLQKYYREKLLSSKGFAGRPEIINRVGLSNIVPFKHILLSDHAISVILKLIDRTVEFAWNKHQASVDFENDAGKQAVAGLIAARASCATMGLRNVKQTFETDVLEPIALHIVQGLRSMRVSNDAGQIKVAPI